MRRSFLALAGACLAAALLAGCANFAPDKPVRPTLYDFGPGDLAEAPAPSGQPLLLGEVEVAGSLDSTAMLYRLGYADPHQLRPYAYARWSAPPAQLLQQRLRQVLGRSWPVMDAAAAAALARRGSGAPRVLRLELEEFSHWFQTETASQGVVRLRATLLEQGGGGEKLLAQRSFSVQRPAPTADAAGGVRALAAAADGVAEALAAWVQQQR